MTPSPPAIALFLNAALWVTMVGLLVLFAVGSVLRDRPVLRHNVCLGGLIALLLIPVALCLAGLQPRHPDTAGPVRSGARPAPSGRGIGFPGGS